MATVMNMSGYEIEREMVVEEYGDEVMSAGWNPEVAMVADRLVEVTHDRAAFPGELANVDVDSFLQKMYRYQR